MFAREEREGNIHGIKVRVGMPTVSYLFYVDDLLMACRANDQDVAFVMTCFNQYYYWLG